MAFDITHLLQACYDRGASDIHMIVGRPPTLRIDGFLVPMREDVLRPEDTEELMRAITSSEHQQRINEAGGVDFGFSFGDIARFRTAVYKEKGRIAINMRLIPGRILTFEEIGLPLMVKDLLSRPRGLILVTGPTGCGKTTTLATMVDYINTNLDRHIITVEDPVEYYHSHKKGIISQRELGVDVNSFSEAIVKGLRMDPDVILVGEMRDLATIEAAITAAETGHLVLATLHTVSAAETVDRVIDVFPPEQQEQVRTQLGASILAVFCQQLILRSQGKGRIACFEIMITTPSIRNIIREKKTFKIPSDIETGAKYGMMPFDTCLFNLYQQGKINIPSMMERAFNPEQIQAKVLTLQKKR